MKWLPLAFVAPGLLLAQPGLTERIEALLNGSPAAARAHWGIQVVDAASGAVLYQKNQDRYFVPASNTKLFSTSLALVRLGPEHRMTTTILADGPLDPTGTIHGNLRLLGGGDTSLSDRIIPFRQKEGRAGDPLRAIEEFAGEIAARGIRRIEGEIVGDDSAYAWAPYGPGWAMDDATWEYGAPVSAIVVNDNAFTLSVKPGAKGGDAARITLNPPFEYYSILNRAQTVASGKTRISIVRRAGSREIEIRGEIAAGDAGTEEMLAIEDPALFAAEVLRDALVRRGIQVTGGAAASHRTAESTADSEVGRGTVLIVRASPPLLELLRVTDKVSQNLHAEIALREVGRVRRKSGSREAGLEELKAFLGEIGVAADGYSINDGSGLSRLNLLTPNTVTKLLGFMANSPLRDSWIGLLPVGGEDGTLSARFKGTAAAGRVHAKTGTLSHVSALSGYIDGKDGRLLAFSIFVNNYNLESREVRGAMDGIVNLLVE